MRPFAPLVEWHKGHGRKRAQHAVVEGNLDADTSDEREAKQAKAGGKWRKWQAANGANGANMA
jgi:hypothetical protein